ncbi:hypothetical protein HMPREF2633_07505 [Neisseria sp. HMSC072C05]|uniref:hypothetical protein n=1 Tax=Neisseria sp. HMSC072C05 TaxID=1715112 RepID=UPI0008A5FCA4|nr:hypothetical protein [Neisseria sp. HMSC072C05]OFM98197.1 hypothetical protein HMPREF2633_07505 [Neisseria sp. HMSC072C05]
MASGIFYSLFFDGVKIQIDKGEEIIYTAKLGLGSGFSTNGTIGWQWTAFKKKKTPNIRVKALISKFSANVRKN